MTDKQKLEEVFEIVFGDDAHNRYSFEELINRLNESIDNLIEKENQ
mgnify:CR=1 FL=1